jgi:hypothetical protein
MVANTNFLENSVACEPLCAFLCFCDLAIHSKFGAKAVKLNFRQFLFKLQIESRRQTLEKPLIGRFPLTPEVVQPPDSY